MPQPAILPTAAVAPVGWRPWRALAGVLLAMLAALGGLAAGPAQARLSLPDARADIDAWPYTTLLPDPAGQLRVDDVLQQLPRFAPPTAPHANLGVQHGVVWLRVPLEVAQSQSGRWLLDVDYPSLDEVQVFVVTDGRAVHHHRLGRKVPQDQRPMAGRSHVLPLLLEPGQEHELLLRVQTTSSMIVPLRLMKPEAYNIREARFQLLQGLATGIGVCLVMYALAHWLSVRDATFLNYALAVSGVSLFFFSYHGLGAQHLWAGQAWLTVNMAPFSVLLAVVGGLLFLERALQARQHSPQLARGMQVGALVAALAALAFVLGAIDYRGAHLAGTLLGPLPVLLGLPAAVRCMRAGDRAAVYIVVGWAIYAVGIADMALLLRGKIPFDSFTNNAFQVGSLAEMLMWLRALGVRMEDTRHQAERAGREREAMRSLAHTDPLTGLPNRRGLAIEIDRLMPRAQPGALLAVYLLDLDGFKQVNDRLGHDSGDELLVAVAQRLRGLLRGRDVVARLGGDEFVVLAADLPGDADARRLGHKLLDAFKEPFVLQGRHPARVGLTVGYALGPLDGQDEASLLKRADAAMYAGKQAGKHCLRRGQASFGLAA